MYRLGIDLGYSSVKIALLDENDAIRYTTYALHAGSVVQTLQDALHKLLAEYRAEDIGVGAITGSGSKFLVNTGLIHGVNEVAAIVEGSLRLNRQVGSIIEIGGQNAKYITNVSAHDKSHLSISMNSNCSAGTGSFLEEQLSRLNLKLEDYSIYAGRATSIPRIAGRCSVFAKTDITHHQQEGASVEDILLGLAYAVVKNYRGAVMKKLPLNAPVLFIGGVAHNQGMTTALRDVLNLREEELIIPTNFSAVGAIGAALLAQAEQRRIDVTAFFRCLENVQEGYAEDQNELALPALSAFGQSDSRNKHYCAPHQKGTFACYLGVDVGSTSTNLVLMDREQSILAYRYLRTFGKPLETVRMGLHDLFNEYGERMQVVGVGVTGSGRYLVGAEIGADAIKDEITSQAKAAVALDSRVDTIFEIGGQDSKYIALQNGRIADFQMNKICAAGTGSFLEEQAAKFAIPINEFGSIALRSQTPISLGERCTVFIETSIAAHLARGARIMDLAAGLCYAIARNYLNRVVGQKKIGDHILFQGGLAYNQGVINAFRALLPGKTLTVPPFFSVTGAYGAALLAQEAMTTEATAFKGFGLTSSKSSRVKSHATPPQSPNRERFQRDVADLIFAGYDDARDPGKKTVGIPRALFTYGMFPMFYAFFKAFDLNVVMSSPTNEETIRLGQEYSLDETCYPVKLINGHVAELVQQKVDYIFFPDLYTVDHPGSSSRKNYGCPYMQLAFKMVNQAMELRKRGIVLLAPTMAFHLGKTFMMKSFSALGETLGKTPEQIACALQKGMQAFHQFEQRIAAHSQSAMAALHPDEKVFVMISKIYGVADPVLNLGIPGKLLDMGYRVLPFYDLPEGDLAREHPNMYWPFGQHILEPALQIAQQPNLYAILLTHHGCGPDTALSHYFREIMADKPYLQIEVDEHSSDVGVTTRLEAFVNSLEAGETRERNVPKTARPRGKISATFTELARGTTLYLPRIFPYAEIFQAHLLSNGIQAEVLPETDAASLAEGRRQTLTNEYFSLTALLGDVFREFQTRTSAGEAFAVCVPQTEGAEVDGQYHRILRTKLDENGLAHIEILAPFIEDAMLQDEQTMQSLCLCVLAGDVIRIAPRQDWARHVRTVRRLIARRQLNLETLKELAETIAQAVRAASWQKHILVIGEPLILYNDFLNDHTFLRLEAQGHRMAYAPLSEALWLFWRDYADQNAQTCPATCRQALDAFQSMIGEISACLSEISPFERELGALIERADHTLGYYSGAFGRYRAAKILGTLPGIHGIIAAASAYENTGISLHALHKGFASEQSLPILHVTFDGNNNENDETKIQSFLYYL